MSIERAEHARWVEAKQQPIEEYNHKVNNILSESASKGFYRPPGSAISDIIAVGQGAKADLTGKNAKLYAEQVDIIFQIDEFALKIALDYAVLELAIYKQGILDELTIETAQMDYDFKTQQADIARLKAEVNARSIVLIKAGADQKAEITEYSIRQEEAKRLGLNKEVELLEAQKETAVERLKVVDALKEVIASEELVVEAEKRKAEALEMVIEAEKVLVGIKEGMIPLHENLAIHKKDQAQAIKDEAVVKGNIVNLGYDRIDVKQAEISAQITQKTAELDVEQTRTGYITASIANEKARNNARKNLTEKKNAVTDTVISMEENLIKEIADLDIDTRLERFVRNIRNDLLVRQQQNIAIGETLTAKLANIEDIANSQYNQIKDCASTRTTVRSCRNTELYIDKG